MIFDDRNTQELVVPDPTRFDPAEYIAEERVSGGVISGMQTPATGEVFPRRPHLGDAAIAAGVGFVLLIVATVAVLAVGAALHLGPSLAHMVPAEIPKETILGETVGYGLTLAVLVPLFRAMWGRRFGDVLHMNSASARANVGKLLIFGVGLSLIAQAAESVLTLPKDMPMDAFFRTPADLWTVALFGVFVAPPIEELLFRGFLLPAFAIAFDWLRLPRTPEARAAWRNTEGLSRAGLVFAGVLTSLLFGAMHAAQLKFAWNLVGLLSCVGGVLAVVRVRFDSVWASAVVHMTYNGFIFAVLFVATDGFRHLYKLHGH